LRKIVTIGPPGSGKTHWAMRTVEGLVAAGVHPQQLCLVTFTTVAAREIKARLRQRFSEYSYDDWCWVGTIHSICRRLLAQPVDQLFAGHQVLEFAKAYHYSFNGDLTGQTDEDIEIKDQMLVSDADWFDQFDNWTRNSLCPTFDQGYSRFFSYYELTHAPDRFTRGTLALYINRKREYLKDKGLLDFPGLIEKVVEHGLRPPAKYLLIDEAQDNSPALWQVLYRWGEACEQMIAIGDPDQAIYGFLPADPGQFLEFAAGAQRVDLQNSHRLPRAVQRLSESWISRNHRRLPRAFFPRNAEGLVQRDRLLTELPWKEWAAADTGSTWNAFLLARTRRQSTALKQWLQDRGVPFAVNRGEENPLQTPKGWLAHAMLKLMDGERVDMQDLDGVIKWMPAKPWLVHGAKKKLAERIKDEPTIQVGPEHLPQLGFTPQFMASLQARDFVGPLKFTEIERIYLRRVYSQFGKRAFSDTPKILATNIHGVKGMEADHVVLSPDLTSMPARAMMKEPEEEHRICYVGITRAKESLHILRPERDTYYRLW
jgi:DNA helicase II / ATP-dependent DNA helicase PcrA